MSSYFVAIGGSGIRVLESLVHMAAAGLLFDSNLPKPVQKLSAIIVDPDQSNGCFNRLRETLNLYRLAREINISGNNQTPLFQTEVELLTDPPWSPLVKPVDNPAINSDNLDVRFQINALRADIPRVARLMETLYTAEERRANLSIGFRGHPSIGAAVFAESIDFQAIEPWRSMYNDLSAKSGVGAGSRIFLAGSIFGGTGASGLPTIAEKLGNLISGPGGGLHDTYTAGLLILPYFHFPEEDQCKELHARSDLFAVNTKTALQDYYEANQKIRNLHAAYFLGCSEPIQIERFCPGSQNQDNPVCWIELVGATGALHFFRVWEKNTQPLQFAIKLKDGHTLRCDDVNATVGMVNADQRLGQMLRFCFAYLNTYYPALIDISRDSKIGYRAPWYVKFFERQSVKLSDYLPRLDQVARYAADFLRWSATIQNSGAGQHNLELFTSDAFANVNGTTINLKDVQEFDHSLFGSLLRGQSAFGIPKLWKRMCDDHPNNGRSKHREIDHVGNFMGALYRNCQLS